MGKKSKRVRKKQTKEEWEKARTITINNILDSFNSGTPYITKKIKKRNRHTDSLYSLILGGGCWGTNQIEPKYTFNNTQ